MAIRDGYNRFSIDLNQELYKRLDTYIKDYNNSNKFHQITKNIIISHCLELFLCEDKRLKDELMSFVHGKMDLYKRLAEQTHGFIKEDYMNTYKEYAHIFYLMNDFSYEIDFSFNQEQNLHDIPIFDGVVRVPIDWKSLNIDDSMTSKYVYVIEFSDFTNKVNYPRFIYFSNEKYGKDLNENDIYSEASFKFREFKDIYERCVIPIYDSRGTILLNEEDIKTRPMVGIFKIPENGERKIGSYPFGAMIIRNKDLEES